MNNNNQGSYAQPEQQWTCPDCETVNTGDNCTVCGCLRPQKKPEDEAQETAAEQGCYTQTFPGWICPNCEIQNAGATCAICGCPRPEKKKPISKKILAAAVIILISTLVGIALWLPYHRYQSACSLLENGQYEQALEMLSRFPDDSQKKEMLIVECVKRAVELCDSGEYVASLKILDSLPDSKAVSLIKTEVCYNYGQTLFEKDQNYKEAYLQFKKLASYRDSAGYIDRVVKEWHQTIIKGSDTVEAVAFRDTVFLTKAQSNELYQELCDSEYYEYLPDGWSYHPYNFGARVRLLSMLPDSPDYPYKAELRTLFLNFDGDQPGIFVQKYRDVVEKLWDLPVMQNIIIHDFCIKEWLLGTWSTENKQYTLEFQRDESNPDIIHSTIDLPWVSEPAGTAYWNIKDMTYVWTGEADNILAEVYRFKLLEPDKIEVYAFKDQKTYTMIRK